MQNMIHKGAITKNLNIYDVSHCGFPTTNSLVTVYLIEHR